MSAPVKTQDPLRPGLRIDNRGLNRASRKLVGTDLEDKEQVLMQDKILKQLKQIRVHHEIITGETNILSQNDDDDSGGSF